MNTATHHYLAGMDGRGLGLGAACATTATNIGAGMQVASGTLAMIPTGVTQIAAGVLAIGSAIQRFFFAPDCNKIATTQIVNQAETFLQQNLSAWQSLPPQEKTIATQQVALQNFDNVWAQVVQACTTGGYGSAGINCVTDREQGACHYQNNGQCWNWFVGYRDPIANDPQVGQNVTAAGSSGTDILSALTGGTIDPRLLLVAAAIGVVVLIGVAS